jgi:hypothetical protein
MYDIAIKVCDGCGLYRATDGATELELQNWQHDDLVTYTYYLILFGG